jgi:ketosteroid isomerase-like protein
VPAAAEISAAEAFCRAADAFYGLLNALADHDWHTPVRFRGRSRRTGKSAAMNLHHYFRLRDGKIAYFRGTEDTGQTEAVLRD